MREGIALFNRAEFFEAHEAMEAEWTPLQGPRRFFLQALIHLAVGFYHHQRANREGAVRQLRKGLKKLAAYLPEYEDVATARLYREAVAALECIENGGGLDAFPLIHHNANGKPGISL